MESVKAALVLATKRGMNVNHFDVETAYLNASLEEELYLKQIPGFECDDPNVVLRLHKGLYGLRQSAHLWGECLCKALTKLGFKQSVADSCLYSITIDGQQCFVLVFVDDICFLYHSAAQLSWFTETIQSQFKIKDLGAIQNYLGVQISRNDDGIFELSQESKIVQLLEKFNMSEAHSVDTPMTTGYCKETDVNVFADKGLYQSLIGSLLYLSYCSRPDICTAVHWLTQKCSNPSQNDWLAAKRVLKYLKGTLHHKLLLNVSNDQPLSAYCDASWGERSDGKSTSGFAVYMFGALVAWKSIKQTHVATSSCEAEFSSMSDCVVQIEWFYQLLLDLYVDCKLPVSVYSDSSSARQLANN